MQTTAAVKLPAPAGVNYDYPDLFDLRKTASSYTALPVEVPPSHISDTPDRKTRKGPLLIRANKVLRAVTVAFWGIALLGYGLDVSLTNEVSKLQDQARRLSEQNMELSARLLKVISFQGIQDSTLGRFGLRVPEQVLIVKEIPPYTAPDFHPQRHHLPLLSGF